MTDIDMGNIYAVLELSILITQVGIRIQPPPGAPIELNQHATRW